MPTGLSDFSARAPRYLGAHARLPGVLRLPQANSRPDEVRLDSPPLPKAPSYLYNVGPAAPIDTRPAQARTYSRMAFDSSAVGFYITAPRLEGPLPVRAYC